MEQTWAGVDQVEELEARGAEIDRLSLELTKARSEREALASALEDLLKAADQSQCSSTACDKARAALAKLDGGK